MDNLTTTFLIYMVAHLWWITYRIGRLEGLVKKLNDKEE